jgi:hypothetical protein
MAGECAQLADEIIVLERRIARLQILLTEPDMSSGTIQRIRKQIFEAETRLGALKRQLEVCRSTVFIMGVEKTQGIQFFNFNGQGSGNAPDNSVPLVAERALILRVYVNHNGADDLQPDHFLPRISGRVTVDRLSSGGSFSRVTVLNSINGAIAARSFETIDRGQADHTLNFRVPANVCQGHLRFSISVFEQSPVIAGTARVAASHSQVVFGRFEPVPDLPIHGVLVHYTGDGMDLPAPSGFALAKTLEFVRRTYPISAFKFDECTEIDFGMNLRTPGGGCGPGFEGPGGLMGILATFEDLSDEPAVHVGLIPKGAMMSVAGCGNLNIAAAKDGGQETLSQEIGHALDRKHAPGAPGPDENYPQYGSYPEGSIGEYGFDIVTSEVHDPNYSTDLMGYGGSRWISPYTYMGLRGTLMSRFADLRMANTGQRLAVEQSHPEPSETLFLSFKLHRDGRLEVQKSFHAAIPARYSRAKEQRSDFHCELLDQQGEVHVFHQCHPAGSHLDLSGPHLNFHEAIPWVDNATAIRFLKGDVILGVHDIEADGPSLSTLKISTVSEGKQLTRLTWTGALGQEDVTYVVRYSNNAGKTWRVVGANITKNEFECSGRRLAGGESCVWQVLATSGIRTVCKESKPVALPRKPRTAVILSSPDNSNEAVKIRNGDVSFLGAAFSPDTGLSAADDNVWTSNLDGFLGAGFEVQTSQLSPGWHLITLTAPDGLGGTATTSAQLRVEE